MGSEYFLFLLQTSENTAMTMRTINMASRKPAPTPVAIPNVAAGKLSSVIIMDVLRKGVVVVGDNLALSVMVTKGRETDDIC